MHILHVKHNTGTMHNFRNNVTIIYTKYQSLFPLGLSYGCGINNSVWLKILEGVNKFLLPQTYLMSWGTKPLCRTDRRIFFCCTKYG